MDKPCSFKNLNSYISCGADKIRFWAISEQDRVIALSEFGLIFGPTSESFFFCKTNLANQNRIIMHPHCVEFPPFCAIMTTRGSGRGTSMKTSWKKLNRVREWLYRLAQVFIIHPIEMNLENNIKSIYMVTFSR